MSKIQGGLQELEETVYWLELLVEAGIVDRSHLCDLFQEAEELIFDFRLLCQDGEKIKVVSQRSVFIVQHSSFCVHHSAFIVSYALASTA